MDREQKLRPVTAAVQDVVILQEVFMEADVLRLIGAAKNGKLKYAHFYDAGMLHGELLLVTAYPIAEVPLFWTLHALGAYSPLCLPCQTLPVKFHTRAATA